MIYTILKDQASRTVSNCAMTRIDTSKKIAVYGVGQGFQSFKKFFLNKIGMEPDIYVDRRFVKNEKFLGKPTIMPNMIDDKFLANYNIILTQNFDSYQSIRAEISASDKNNIFSAFDFFLYHATYSNDELTRGNFHCFDKHREKIEFCYANLLDKKSKKLFQDILLLYMSKRISRFDFDNPNEQYLPKDLPVELDYRHVINCGAYDGDTVQNIIVERPEFQFAVCFEPDIDNFSALVRNLSGKKNKFSDVTVLQAAVGSEVGCFGLDKGGTNSTLVDVSGGKRSCLQLNLDSLASARDWTFINMDIEGAELDALKGCHLLLSKLSPDLAISIYHRIEHLWEIQNYISSINSNYNFWLRNYSGFPSETILYASVKCN